MPTSDIYTYNTKIKYRDKISVINRQSQLTTFTSNQPTVGLYCEKSNSMYQAQFTRILSPRDTKILQNKTEIRFDQFD